MDKLQVILKVAERCNIACDYCYYFFGGDESYKDRPAYLTAEVARKLIAFLTQGVTDLDLQEIEIIFHGGEPLMIGKERFATFCENFRSGLQKVVKLRLSVQTNGMLVDEGWVELFERLGVGVGVSLDGPRDLNDKHRIDKRGKGTHGRVVAGLNAIKAGHAAGSGIEPALLTVVDPEGDTGSVLRHFHTDLGIKRIGYLLPDHSHDSALVDTSMIRGVGVALKEMIDFAHSNPAVRIREVENFYAHFQERSADSDARAEPVRNHIIVVQSDGTLALDDSFMPTGSWRTDGPTGSIVSMSLAQWLAQPVYEEIRTAQDTLPDGCTECAWSSICRGGDLENRYSKAAGFNNPSVYCEALKVMYLAGCERLIREGYPRDRLLSRLTSRGEAILA